MLSNMKIATLILAAGSSKRMGKPKQLLAFKNSTLLGAVIENVSRIPNNNVYCVVGANAQEIIESIKQYSITTILNNEYRKGLSSSIVSGINYIQNLDYEAVLIVLADQPNVSAEYLQKMIGVSKENENQIIASNYKDRNGVPALFPKKHFEILLQLNGDKGASKLLNSNVFPIFTMNDDVDLFDIDTKTDYDKLITKKL